jgi:hypothetical protein
MIFKSKSTTTCDSSKGDFPDVESYAKAAGQFIIKMIQDDTLLEKQLNPEDGDLFYFNEEKYISENPNEFDDGRKSLLRMMPNEENIFTFIMVK